MILSTYIPFCLEVSLVPQEMTLTVRPGGTDGGPSAASPPSLSPTRIHFTPGQKLLTSFALYTF